MTSHRPRLLTALLATLLTATAPAHATQEAEDIQLLQQSRDLLKKGDARTALIQLKKAVKANPGNAEARYELGLLEFRSGDLIAAEKEMTQAREGGFPAAKVSPVLASILLAEGKLQPLLKTVSPCPEDAACKADVLALRARAYLALRDIDNAEKESLASLEAVPDANGGRMTRALVLMARHEEANAETLIDQVLAGNSQLAEALIIKGDLRRRAGDAEKAIASYRAAAELSPRDANLRQSLAMTLMAAGQDAEARTQVDKALELSPNSVMGLYLKGSLLLRSGKNTEALEAVRPAEAAIASQPQGAYLLAMIHTANNNLEAALNYASRFHAQVPDNLQGAKLLADLHFRSGSYGKVISLLAPLRDRLMEDGAALDLLGSAYMAEGQISEANALLETAVKLHPDDPQARARLAVNQTRNSASRQDGIRELEKLAQSNPENQQVDLALVSTYISSGEFDQAIATATAMAQHQPDAPMPLAIRGAAKMAKKDVAGARADFEAALAKKADYTPATLYLAQLEMGSGNSDQARALLDRALKRDPNDLRSLLARAKLEIQAGTPPAALPFLETAIRSHSTEIEPRSQMIRLLLGLKQADKAVAAATDLARTLPNNPAAVDLAARVLFGAQKMEDGLELYKKLATAFPDAPESNQRYGQALVTANRLEEARQVFDRILSVDPHYLPAWVNRIALARKMQGDEAALALAEKAVQNNPANPSAAVLPGDLLLAEGKAAEAESRYLKIHATTPTPATAGRVFQAMLKKGDPAGAGRFLEAWLAKTPGDLEARLQLAAHKLAQNDVAGAIAHYEEVLKTLPRSAPVLNNLAWAYGRVNDPRAVETAKRALELTPEAPPMMDTYGYLLYRSGQREQGGDLVARAYKANQQDPQIAYHMARVLADRKEAEEARKLLKGVIEAKASFEEAEDARKLYGELGGS